ncbi:hypothetical protein F5Y19DRAFT_479079 [Xylariaceae sp. FL1651]|nr:hypothetical protein F5Y19DRAFT_479079 [Xylariaceae sp. FL1651]
MAIFAFLRIMLAIGPCSEGINITSQEDLDAYFDSCNPATPLGFINAQASNITLKFPAGLNTENITVIDFSGVHSLDLSTASFVDSLYLDGRMGENEGHLALPIVDGSHVFNISLNSINAVNISGGASNTQDWSLRNVGYAALVEVKSVSQLLIYNSLGLFFQLEDIYALKAGNGSVLSMPMLSRVSGNAELWGYSDLESVTFSNIRVGGHLTLRQRTDVKNAVSTLFDGQAGSSSSFKLSVQSVGGDLVLSEVPNATVIFSDLMSVGSRLAINSSPNSTFAFGNLTAVGSIEMESNANSPLPGGFRSLEFADTIHLNGHIDTSTTGNLFPSLRQVRGSVIIEAWNSDFNCSRLVSQQRDGSITHLYCNGTDNGNSTTISANRAQSHDGLSRGAWAGMALLLPSLFWESVFENQLLRNTPPTEEHRCALQNDDYRQVFSEAEGDIAFPPHATAIPSPVEVDATTRPVEADSDMQDLGLDLYIPQAKTNTHTQHTGNNFHTSRSLVP